MEALTQEFFSRSNELVYNHHSAPVDPSFMSEQRFSNPSSFSGINNHVEKEFDTAVEEEEDYPDATLKYISQMLMEEEDLENQPFMSIDSMALQATEKNLSDVLHGSDGLSDNFSNTHLSNSLSIPFEGQHDFVSPASRGREEEEEENETDHSSSKGKRNHQYSSSPPDSAENERNNKYLAAGYMEEFETLDDTYYDAFVCPMGKNITACLPKKTDNSEQKVGRKNRRGKKKQETKKKFVDLRGLLTHCAQSVAVYDSKTANEALKKIRLHSSPHGNETERLAFYLANALEARSNGAGPSLYTSNPSISAADILRAYQTYISVIPFEVVSTMMGNKCIMKLVAAGATRLHIIDFGILYGFHWACFIHGLSVMPGGPPRLRITGIEFPHPGFYPEERVRATGLRLEKHCKKLNVPFEFKAIASKWESITLEDLELDRDDDVLVVNCLDRLANVPDEMTGPNNSPRDMVLNLIKNINPDVFIHAVVNGTYNNPFFDMRFRESLFHFYSLFDIMEVTLQSEDKDRQLLEEMVFKREVLNVIACEGTERVERPETYKKWHARTLRAGFQQLPLDQEAVKCLREKVRSEYDKNFSVDEDENWMLQGWKGRILKAVSCWKPDNN
ncbi:unnamed protein product [Cuscuta epithymum]|uniref:Uncharacterized protein n=1 Tax=Cuscuta epithymum TaxID=186058 RepID=A0AAV0DT63_9ASTE|nr:unnamed protein product [Cuscuta epithymum]